jgi:hypothetical protein
MWFAALSPEMEIDWLLPFVEKLLQNDQPTLRLLRHNPFPDRPPRAIRAQLYAYRFTTFRERRETGAWWVRRRVEDVLPPITLTDSPTEGS